MYRFELYIEMIYIWIILNSQGPALVAVKKTESGTEVILKVVRRDLLNTEITGKLQVFLLTSRL